MLDANGKPINGEDQQEIPAIMVGWNEQVQDVAVKFDSQAFKTWDFVILVLEMAKRKAEHNLRMQQAAMMQQAAIEQQQAAMMQHQLRGGRKHSG